MPLTNVNQTTQWLLIGSPIILMIFCLFFFSTSVTLFIVNRAAAFQSFQHYQSVHYGQARAQQMDIFRPDAKSEKLLPVVVFFYGGCWGACSHLKKEDYAFVAESFSSNRIVAVVPDYRVYPDVNFNEIMNDASSLVEWVHSHIQDYGGDPKQIFLMGHSSGAHLAAMLAVNRQYLAPQTYGDIKGFIGLAGPYNFLPFDEDYMPILFGSLASPADSQPIHFIDGTQPPLLLMHGATDTRVKPSNAETMAKKALDVGGNIEKHIYEDIDHAAIVGEFSILLRNKSQIFSDTLDFIKKYSIADSEAAKETADETADKAVNN